MSLWCSVSTKRVHSSEIRAHTRYGGILIKLSLQGEKKIARYKWVLVVTELLFTESIRCNQVSVVTEFLTSGTQCTYFPFE